MTDASTSSTLLTARPAGIQIRESRPNSTLSVAPIAKHTANAPAASLALCM